MHDGDDGGEDDELLVELAIQVNPRVRLSVWFPVVVTERVVGARLHSVTCNGKCDGQCGEHE